MAANASTRGCDSENPTPAPRLAFSRAPLQIPMASAASESKELSRRSDNVGEFNPSSPSGSPGCEASQHRDAAGYASK